MKRAPARPERRRGVKLSPLQVVLDWVRLLRGGPLREVSGAQVGRVVADHLVAIIKALGDVSALGRALAA